MPYGVLAITKPLCDHGKSETIHLVRDFITQCHREKDGVVCEMSLLNNVYEFYMDHPDFIEVERPRDAHYILHIDRKYQDRDYTDKIVGLSLWYYGKIRRIKSYV